MIDHKGSVLILEDTPSEGTELQEELEKRGYKAKWVPNKQLAVEELQGKEFYVALLADIHLGPNQDALDFTVKAVKDWPMSYIICMSGYQNSPLIDNVQGVCDFYTNKPVDIDSIADKIEQEGRIKREKMTEQFRRANNTLNDLETSSRNDDVNLNSYTSERDEVMKKHQGQYVAYLDGKLVGTNSNKLKLMQDVFKQYHKLNIFIVKVDENKRRLHNVSARKKR